MQGLLRGIPMQEGSNNSEEGVKLGILLHSHKDSVSLSFRAGAVLIFIASTIIVSEQLLITNGFLLRALQRGVLFFWEMRTDVLMRVAAVFMASMLLFSFHGKRAATLPLPVPRVLGGAFLYAVPAASSSLWIQGWLLLLCPTNPHPAGTKSSKPHAPWRRSPQPLHLPTLAAAQPHPHGASSPRTRDWGSYGVFWISDESKQQSCM